MSPPEPRSQTDAPVDRWAAFRALGHVDYRRVWLAMLIGQTGMWMQITARAVLVFDITGSAAALGVIYLATYSPQLVFSLLGGVLADRFDRRWLVIVTSVAQAVFAGILGVLAATGTATLTNLIVISFLVGIFQALMGPAQMSLLPALVPKAHLHSAISLLSTAMSTTRILGPLAAGAAIPLWGVDVAFYLNALAFIGPIQAWLRTPVTNPVDESAGRPIRAVLDGLAHIRRTPQLASPLVMMAFISAVGLVYQPLGVAYTTDVLADGARGLGSSYYGVLQAAIGVGSIVGIVGLAGIGRRQPAAVAFATALGFGAVLATLGVVDHFGVAVVITFGIGVTHFTNATLLQTLVQHAAPEVMRGRVMAVFQAAFVGFFPFTSALFGWVADATSVQTTFLATGASIVVFSAVLTRWRGSFRFEGEAEPVPAPSIP